MAEVETTEADAEQLSTSTHFAFEHKIFKVKGAHFRLTHDTRTPALYVMLGDMTGAIPVSSICQEFDIEEESSDAELLRIVSSSLKFVREIHPNDSIPSEILDGSASWSIEERHRNIARGRITMQLVSWLSGTEEIITNSGELEAIASDPGTKEKVQNAFKEIANKLGITKDDVVEKVDDVIRELSYIEALREHYMHIKKIGNNVDRLKTVYRRDRGMIDDLTRIHALIDPVISDFDRTFDELDAQTCEVLTILKNFDPTIEYIRKTRDDLHQRFMIWDDMIKGWKNLGPEENTEVEKQLKKTYRFLAQNFMQGQSWRLGNM
ncbi:hypothetical protein [Sneathiella glossodoripedis]|uniref:hypothetical protein n=1 Tax=Sneathiella glossodoripedis TaxID=418853 RepID=UPI0004714D28|nr:hypothetical protein [Sneathiella glossodoripedis]